MNSPSKDSDTFDSLFGHHLTAIKSSQSFMMGPRHSLKSSNCSSNMNSSINKGVPAANRLDATRLKGLK